MKIIDLSVSLKAGIPSDPKEAKPEIEYSDHTAGARQMASVFKGLNTKNLKNEEGWASENLKLTSHSGTHMDAPYHFNSTQDNGSPMPTIDEIPLENFIGKGVKFDFRHFENGHVITASEVAQELNRINHILKPDDIVVVNTAAGARYGADDYLSSGVGMGREATLYLTERGVKVVGTDAWSWDAPFNFTAEKFAKTKDSSIIWEGHYSGTTIPYYQMEKMGNLDLLPDDGFTIICQPINIYKASAGWVRPMAILK
ncbi:cyclase family protein [Leuconostoc gelidum subsp. gelidum]|uniref:cyclase family protein n=1 Tax=Leuconostoc gelidum TaxID=1244 RepID=UPI001CC80728|nr:cyclase family protein [Leuconostoc gelidum]MBZ6013686.1 cyclase family protein [Leuconostoc gelidum subsp. gelidum]